MDQDVSEALPYLNASLGGFTYIKDPPSVTLRVYGKLITVYGDRIAVNALKDEEEADKILNWLKGEINEAWGKRDQIQPSFESAPQPLMMEILKTPAPGERMPGLQSAQLHGVRQSRCGRGQGAGRMPPHAGGGPAETAGISGSVSICSILKTSHFK